MSSLIQVKEVKKSYPMGKVSVEALRGVSLEVYKGEFLSIIGPSGSGKTTLMNIIGLIDNATAGDLFIGDTNIATLSDRKLTDLRLHTLGFIFQTFNLIPVLNAVENVEFPLLLQNKESKKEIRSRALGLLDAVGIKEYATHRPAELSGGQRQRVAIARALIASPSIVLADEPTANLDSVTGHQILDIMKQMNKKSDTTFIFSTHNPDVLQYADRTIVIRDGLIAEK